MATPEHKRRSMDSYGFDIEAMIMAEEDPKNRAFLVVMNNINMSLISNTQAVTDLRSEFSVHKDIFQQHATQEEKIFNQGKGMWRIISVVIAIVQVIFGYGWMETAGHLKSIDAAIATSQLNDAKNESRWAEHDRVKK